MIGGLELHPWIVHFPVALVPVSALFALAYLILRREWLRWFAPLLLTLALLGAVGAYFSGQSAKDRAEDLNVPKSAIEEHETSGIWAMGLTGLACLLAWATHAGRRGIWIATLVAAVATAATFRTGHLGGKLVFVHGAGRVKPATGGAAAGAPAARSGR